MYYGVCNHACCALRTKNAQERTQKSASTECVCTLARLELSFRRKRSASLYSYCHATANPLRFCLHYGQGRIYNIIGKRLEVPCFRKIPSKWLNRDSLLLRRMSVVIPV